MTVGCRKRKKQTKAILRQTGSSRDGNFIMLARSNLLKQVHSLLQAAILWIIKNKPTKIMKREDEIELQNKNQSILKIQIHS